MKRKEWLRLLLADAITVFLLLTGGLLSGLSAYGIPAYGTALLLAGAVLAPLAALLWSWSRGHWPALALLAAGLLALWRIREGLKSLLNPSPGLEELLALPAALCFLLRWMGTDPLILGVAVTHMAMPAAVNGSLLCMEYGGDAECMAQITFVSTLASIVTIPIIAALLL